MANKEESPQRALECQVFTSEQQIAFDDSRMSLRRGNKTAGAKFAALKTKEATIDALSSICDDSDRRGCFALACQ